MKTIAYMRISTNSQELQNQKLAILNYAQHNHLQIDHFLEITALSRKSLKKRGLDSLFTGMQAGDLLLVSELSRLGRSVGQIIQLVDELIKHPIKFIAIKENIHLDGKQGEIMMLLTKKVSKASIAKILSVSRSTLLYFIKSRELC